MSFIKANIVATAKKFWETAGQKQSPPFDISQAVSLVLPVDIVMLSDLSLMRIRAWLAERDLTFDFDLPDRNLHGFIITYRGSGFIFANGSDNEAERRYTIAHEASHFILDYYQPRQSAIAQLGKLIEDVLDGLREPTNEERIDGLLRSVSVKPYTHLMEKQGDGSFYNVNVYNSENDADALALELLAPYSRVIRETKSGNLTISFDDFKIKSQGLLEEKYLLPGSMANEYATRLSYLATGGPSLLKKFGF